MNLFTNRNRVQMYKTDLWLPGGGGRDEFGGWD